MKMFRTMRVAIGLCILMALFSGEAWSATWTVTNGGDDGGVGCLRWVVNVASTGDTINFISSVSTVSLKNEYLFLASAKTLTINGPVTIKQTASGKRVIYNAGDTTLNNVTITGGALSSTGMGGAGIVNVTKLTMNNCTVTENSLSGSYVNGGGILNMEELIMNNCTVSNNKNIATGYSSGGGIYNIASAYDHPILTMTNCIVEGNSITADGFGGGIFNGEIATLDGCIVRNNSSRLTGGGIFTTAFSTTTLKNKTQVISNQWNQVDGDSYSNLVTDGTCVIGGSPASAPFSIYGAAKGEEPKPRKIIGEEDIVVLEAELDTTESAILADVSRILSSDLGHAPNEVSATLYDAFTYENVLLSDDSGTGKLDIEFTASWPENVRYYAALAQADGLSYIIPSRGIDFEIKPGQSLPNGVTPPDFYIPGEGLMTWRNAIYDNGSFDIEPAVGKVTFRVASIRAEDNESQDRSSGAGCNVGGLPVGFALLLVPFFALALRRR